MRVLPLLLLAVPLLAVAAPVPKETEAQKIARLFGEAVDEKKTCELSLSDGKLRVKAKPCREATEKHAEVMATNHLAVLRDVTGEFEFTTTVSMEVPGAKMVFDVDVVAAVGVGAFSKDGRTCLFTRYYGRTGAAKNKNGWASSLFVCRVLGAEGTMYSNENTTEFTEIKDCHVRVKREGNKLWFGRSKDGKEWDRSVLLQDYSDTLRIGLIVHNDTSHDVECTFTEPVLRLPVKK